MHNFIKYNDKKVMPIGDWELPYDLNEKTYLEYLKQSIESGLILDEENEIFIREGFGALVGFCPDNCNTLEELLNFKYPDFRRKVVGKPTLFEKLREIKNKETLFTDSWFGYKRIAEEGYDLVIGPGCSYRGEKWQKAVYCKNYLEILEREKQEETESRKTK